MDTPKPLRPVVRAAFEWLAALAIVALIVTFVVPHPRQLKVEGEQPHQSDAAVSITGLEDYAYVPGLGRQFAALGPFAACAKWGKLPEPERFGLAFVSPKQVPDCADGRYVKAAAAARAARLHKPYLWQGHTEYFDLGTPAFASYYDPSYNDSQSYSCSYLKKLVSTNYVTDPMPQPKDQYVETAADEKAFSAWENEVEGVNQIFTLYAQGGKFDPGCYPPGVVFGKDYSVTFYPNSPVSSLSETPAPVFTGSARCNVCFRGPVYRVKPGDTLEKISTCFFGDRYEQYDIQWNNNLSDRDVRFLQIGQKLHIPDVRRLGRCVKPDGL